MAARPEKINVEAAQKAFPRLKEDRQIGIDSFIFSGYPHLQEAHRFGELVMPHLSPDHGIPARRAPVETGSFGEPISGDQRPAMTVSQS